MKTENLRVTARSDANAIDLGAKGRRGVKQNLDPVFSPKRLQSIVIASESVNIDAEDCGGRWGDAPLDVHRIDQHTLHVGENRRRATPACSVRRRTEGILGNNDFA